MRLIGGDVEINLLHGEVAKRGIPAIFSSGYLDDKAKFEIVKEKGYGYIQKPYDLDDMLAMVALTLKRAGK